MYLGSAKIKWCTRCQLCSLCHCFGHRICGHCLYLSQLIHLLSIFNLSLGEKADITDHNAMLYLGLIEKKISKITTHLYYEEKQVINWFALLTLILKNLFFSCYRHLQSNEKQHKKVTLLNNKNKSQTIE